MTRARTALNDRTVLITGAARGIGEHLARRLHAAGANVALVGLEPERLQRLRTELATEWRSSTPTSPTPPRSLPRPVSRSSGPWPPRPSTTSNAPCRST